MGSGLGRGRAGGSGGRQAAHCSHPPVKLPRWSWDPTAPTPPRPSAPPLRPAADVLTIENSRSGDAMVRALAAAGYAADLGPGELPARAGDSLVWCGTAYMGLRLASCVRQARALAPRLGRRAVHAAHPSGWP